MRDEEGMDGRKKPETFRYSQQDMKTAFRSQTCDAASTEVPWSTLNWSNTANYKAKQINEEEEEKEEESHSKTQFEFFYNLLTAPRTVFST